MDYTVHGILQVRILEWGSISLLQGIFPTQGSNPGLLHCRRILYQMSCKGSPANPTTKSSSLKGRCTFSCGSGTFLTVDMSVSPAAAGALRTESLPIDPVSGTRHRAALRRDTDVP